MPTEQELLEQQRRSEAFLDAVSAPISLPNDQLCQLE
jgi:hypothetical protein